MEFNNSEDMSLNNSKPLQVLSAGIDDSFYLSIFIRVPGVATNIISLVLIVRDARRTQMPTNFLLFMLCITDLLALCTTLLWHTMDRFGIINTYGICAVKVYTQSFCPIFSGLVSVFMAIDRAMAFCAPFFYRKNVTKKIWSLVCLIGFLFVSCICLLPHMGLGSMWTPQYKNNTVTYRCSAFQTGGDSKKKTFLILSSTMGLFLITAIICCNLFVIIAMLRLRQRNLDAKKFVSSPVASKSTELRFTVIIGVLACVFVVCWAPYYVWVLYKLLDAYMPKETSGNIHKLAGFSFTIDPFVYLIIRKSNRQALRRFFCYFCKTHETLELSSGNAVNTLSSSMSTNSTSNDGGLKNIKTDF